MTAIRNRFYKLFSDSNPETVDLSIEQFLTDGRKQIERQDTFTIQEKAVPTPIGITLPAGMQQVEMIMRFHTLLKYEGNKTDLEKKKAAMPNSTIIS